MPVIVRGDTHHLLPFVSVASGVPTVMQSETTGGTEGTAACCGSFQLACSFQLVPSHCQGVKLVARSLSTVASALLKAAVRLDLVNCKKRTETKVVRGKIK